MSLEQYIRDYAIKLGFGAIGFARVGPSQSSATFRQWLAKGYCAEMHYLKRHASLRSNPRNLAPPATPLSWQAKSIIVVAARYPSEDSQSPISNYARGSDYHDVLRVKLEQLSAALDDKTGRTCGGRICIDSSPLPEREWAVRAGIGWLGKQGSVVNPELGCCFFLGELLVNIELEPSLELQPQCGDCRLCVNACPMGAILPGNLIDARRCISYLTVEHKGEIAPALAARMGNAVFGCDRCTTICPWNCRGKAPVMDEFNVSPSAVPALDELSALNQGGFKKKFRGTPLERIGLERFSRNVKVALANQKKSH